MPLHVCIYSLCCLNSIWTKKWYQIQPTQFFSCRCLASSCLLVIFLGRSCAYSTQHGTLLSSRRSSFAHLSWVEPSLKCSEFVKLTTHRICKHFLLLHVWSTVPVYCCVSAILVDGDISISCHLLYENYPVVSCHYCLEVFLIISARFINNTPRPQVFHKIFWIIQWTPRFLSTIVTWNSVSGGGNTKCETAVPFQRRHSVLKTCSAGKKTLNKF